MEQTQPHNLYNIVGNYCKPILQLCKIIFSSNPTPNLNSSSSNSNLQHSQSITELCNRLNEFISAHETFAQEQKKSLLKEIQSLKQLCMTLNFEIMSHQTVATDELIKTKISQEFVEHARKIMTLANEVNEIDQLHLQQQQQQQQQQHQQQPQSAALSNNSQGMVVPPYELLVLVKRTVDLAQVSDGEGWTQVVRTLGKILINFPHESPLRKTIVDLIRETKNFIYNPQKSQELWNQILQLRSETTKLIALKYGTATFTGGPGFDTPAAAPVESPSDSGGVILQGQAGIGKGNQVPEESSSEGVDAATFSRREEYTTSDDEDPESITRRNRSKNQGEKTPSTRKPDSNINNPNNPNERTRRMTKIKGRARLTAEEVKLVRSKVGSKGDLDSTSDESSKFLKPGDNETETSEEPSENLSSENTKEPTPAVPERAIATTPGPVGLASKRQSKAQPAAESSIESNNKSMQKTTSMQDVSVNTEPEYRDLVLESIIKVIRDRFSQGWEELPDERREIFKKEVLRIISAHTIERNNTLSLKKIDSYFDQEKTPKGKDRTARESTRVGESPSNRSRKISENRDAKKKKEERRESTISVTRDGSKKKALARNRHLFSAKTEKKKHEFQLVQFLDDEDDEVITLCKKLSTDVLQFLEQIAGFIENHRQIPVYYIPKPPEESTIIDEKIKGIFPERISSKETLEKIRFSENAKKSLILNDAFKVMEKLREFTKILPKVEDIAPVVTGMNGESGSDKDPALKQSMLRILKSVQDPLEPKSQEFDQNLLLEGFYVQLVKNNILGSVWYNSTRLYNVTSLLMSSSLFHESSDYSANLHLLSFIDLMNQVFRTLLNDMETFYTILNWDRENLKKYEESDFKKPKPKFTENYDIWNLSLDENRCEDPKTVTEPRWAGGTLNNLIIRVTHESLTPTSDFIDTIIILYSAYTTPHGLFEKVAARFHTPQNISGASRSFIKLRVIKFLVAWIKKDFYRFDPSLLDEIRNFVVTALQQDSNLNLTASRQLVASILEELTNETRFCHKTQTFNPKTLPVYASDTSAYRLKALFNYTEQQIAEHLSITEMELYKRIETYELLDLKWSKDKLNILAKHLMNWIQRANQVSHWVATMILLQPSTKDRLKAVTLFINIAQQLFDMVNFNGMISVLNGLNISAVSRLHITWAQISKKDKETFDSLMAIQNPSSSFAVLRKTMDKAGKFLPPLPIHLTDLTATGEISDIVTDDSSGNSPIINIRKYSIICRTITRLLSYQQHKFPDSGTKVELQSYLSELPWFPESELFQLSLEREPRGCLPKDLIEKEKKKEK